jgi:hypothetical protein
MGCAAELASHLAHYFGASDFEHRGPGAPDLAKNKRFFLIAGLPSSFLEAIRAVSELSGI